MSEYTVQRPRHSGEVQRVDEQGCVADLPVPHELPKLHLVSLSSLRRLLLEGAERPKLTLSVNDLFHGDRTEGTSQLLLQVCDTHVETESFHIGASEVGSEAGALESTPELILLSGVAEACQPGVAPLRAENVQEASDVVRTTHGHERNALRVN